MRRQRLLLLPVILALLIPAGPAAASILTRIDAAETLSKRYLTLAGGKRTAVKGKRERRQVRIGRWVAGLSGDRAQVFAERGMPPFRWFESFAGRRTETWSYLEGGTYVFQGNRLLHHRRF